MPATAAINIITGVPFPSTTFNVGTSVAVVPGKHTDLLVANALVAVYGTSTSNDGYYEVLSSIYTGGNTEVTVASYTPGASTHPGTVPFVSSSSGTLLLVGTVGGSSAYSISFTPPTANAGWFDIAMNTGTIVLSGYESSASLSAVIRTTNGTSWTEITVPVTDTSETMYGIANNGSTFTSVGGSGSIVTSTNSGATWSLANDGNDIYPANIFGGNGLISVSYLNGQFVAVGLAGTNQNLGLTQPMLATSPDATTWTLQDSTNSVDTGSGYDLQGVTYGASTYVGVGGDVSQVSTKPIVVTSSDGVTWTKQGSPPSENLSSVTFGAGLFVAVGRDSTNVKSGTIWTSTNGVTWTQRTNPMSGTGTFNILGSVRFTNGGFTAVTSGYNPSGDTGILTSSDGITWTEDSDSTTPPLSTHFPSVDVYSSTYAKYFVGTYDGYILQK